MNIQKQRVFIILLPLLTACASPEIKLKPTTSTAPIDSTIKLERIDQKIPFSQNELTIIKSGKVLSLVRVMEGGACKNKKQGAVGLFGLYASQDDITRIKKTQNSEIFTDFEDQIQNFSMNAVQGAIKQLDFQDNTSTQQQLSKKLRHLFSNLIADDIYQFENTRTLSIDVVPMEGSLVFHFDDCTVPHTH